jgi:fructose transport system substrate-binding protein
MRATALTAAAAIGAASLALAAGCTVERHWGGGTAASGKARVGLVTKTDTNPYFVALREDAARAAQRLGADFSALAGQFDGDNDGQVRAIENLMQQRVSTILITPNSSTGVLDAIDRARKSGVQVLAVDTATEPPTAVDATYATDNLAAGRQQGSYVRGALAGAAPRLLMMDGTPGSSVNTLRHNGFLQGIGLADGDPAIVGAQPANGDQSLAQQGMENLLQRTSDVNAVYTMNEPTGRGSHAALQARGLADTVVLGSIDGGCDGIGDVAAGRLRATVLQFPSAMAEQAVAAAVDHARTGRKATGFHATGSVVVTDRPVPGVDSQGVAWGRQNCWGKEGQ